MMATLEWMTPAVCCAALLLRVPDAVRGRNRAVFGILFLGTLGAGRWGSAAWL